MKTKTVRHLAVPLLCMLLVSVVQAQTATKEVLYVRTLAATCANCHGTDGKAVAGSTVTSLAGLDKAYFVAQMAAFKSGARTATVMHQISKGFNDAQIQALAGYFSEQKK
ncbi:MAG: c-type cytochrome [Pseudomonadota bacterium]